LTQRVLFSGGAAPSGDALDAVRKRFEALGRMGAADQLATMAAGAPDALSDPVIAQYAAQAELARGRRPEACARGRGATVDDPPPAFFLRLRAYCSAATGDRAAADLALAVGRGGGADDAWYRAAIGAIGAAGGHGPAARYDNALVTQLSIAAHLRPAANALNGASTLALLTLARSQDAPQPLRAQAAATALRRAALPPTEARTILLATPETITAGVPAMATVVHQVDAAPGSLEAASAIAGLLRQPSDFMAAARLFRADINAFRSAPDQAAALLFARAALMNGDAQDAERLINSARQAGANEGTLAPLEAAVLALSNARGAEALLGVKRRIDNAGPGATRAAARDVTLLVALGASTDDAVQAFLDHEAPRGGAPGDAATMQALTDALQRGAVGEAALLAALAIQPQPSRLDVETVAHVIGALRTLGLESDARRLAVEAILAGPPLTPAEARRRATN
jgi:hypothetical protein